MPLCSRCREDCSTWQFALIINKRRREGRRPLQLQHSGNTPYPRTGRARAPLTSPDHGPPPAYSAHLTAPLRGPRRLARVKPSALPRPPRRKLGRAARPPHSSRRARGPLGGSPPRPGWRPEASGVSHFRAPFSTTAAVPSSPSSAALPAAETIAGTPAGATRRRRPFRCRRPPPRAAPRSAGVRGRSRTCRLAPAPLPLAPAPRPPARCGPRAPGQPPPGSPGPRRRAAGS